MVQDLIENIKKRVADTPKKADTLDMSDPNAITRQMISQNLLKAMSQSNDKKVDMNETLQAMIASIGQMSMIKQIPKLMSDIASDGETKHESGEIKALKEELARMREENRQEKEERRRREEMEKLLNPLLTRLDKIESRYGGAENQKEERALMKEISSVKQDFADVITKLDKKERDEQTQAFVDRIEDIEGKMQMQYNALFQALRAKESGGKNESSGTWKEAMRQLMEEKQMMEELGLIKKDLQNDGKSESAMQGLNDVMKRLPEIIESGKSVYDMVKGEAPDEEEDIPPYENEPLERSAPTMERKPAVLPPDLRNYLDSGHETDDPTDPEKQIWVDQWNVGYNNSDGTFLTRDEIELQMKMHPDTFRDGMKRSKDMWLESQKSKRTPARKPRQPEPTAEEDEAGDHEDGETPEDKE